MPLCVGGHAHPRGLHWHIQHPEIEGGADGMCAAFPTQYKDLWDKLCHFGQPSRVRQALRKCLYAPGFRARTCRGAPQKSNMEVIQGTGALLRLPGLPRQGFPDFRGSACGLRGNARAAIPCSHVKSQQWPMSSFTMYHLGRASTKCKMTAISNELRRICIGEGVPEHCS